MHGACALRLNCSRMGLCSSTSVAQMAAHFHPGRRVILCSCSRTSSTQPRAATTPHGRAHCLLPRPLVRGVGSGRRVSPARLSFDAQPRPRPPAPLRPPDGPLFPRPGLEAPWKRKGASLRCDARDGENTRVHKPGASGTCGATLGAHPAGRRSGRHPVGRRSQVQRPKGLHVHAPVNVVTVAPLAARLFHRVTRQGVEKVVLVVRRHRMRGRYVRRRLVELLQVRRKVEVLSGDDNSGGRPAGRWPRVAAAPTGGRGRSARAGCAAADTTTGRRCRARGRG